MRRLLPVLLVLAACAGSPPRGMVAGEPSPRGPVEAAIETLPPVDDTFDPRPPVEEPSDGVPSVERPGTASGRPAGASAIALIDDERRLAVFDRRTGALTAVREGWSTRPSLDGTYAVSTVIVSNGDTKVAWATLPDGDVFGGTIIEDLVLEQTASQLDGDLAAFVNPAEPVAGAIAGARTRSTIVVAGPAGERWRTELDGNFVPEAFGRRAGVGNLPAQLFLLEYVPAEHPRFYRVRVLSLDTGAISLPLNLRNKIDQVDERMAGFSRSQVAAGDHGLLFTLYRGTIDGTPDGDPYAFVHTLDFADGVWCLDVDPTLELDTLPGTLAVGGDRLYVASANGLVGSFEIPSISDPTRSPTMTWVERVDDGDAGAPLALADDHGVLLSYGGDRLLRVGADGMVGDPVVLPGPAPTAIALDQHGDVQAIAADWKTWGSPPARPAWFGAASQLFVSP